MAPPTCSIPSVALLVLLSTAVVARGHAFWSNPGRRQQNRLGRFLLMSGGGTSQDSEEEFKVAVYSGDGAQAAALAPKVDLDKPGFGGYTALIIAIRNGDIKMVNILLRAGADPDAKSYSDIAPMHKAAYLGDADSIVLLISAGADVSIQGPRLLTPLHYAAFGNEGRDYDPSNLIFSIGGQDPIKEVSGDRYIAPKDNILAPFENHRIPNHLGVVTLLVANGANVNALSQSRETPLHYVSVFDRFQTATILVQAGADIEIADAQKETALHEATAYGAQGVVEVLLISGANTYAKEQNNLDPREFICKCREYHGDHTLNQCAPLQCMSTFDRLVIETLIDKARGA